MKSTLKETSTEELKKIVKEKRDALRDLRFSLSSSTTRNVKLTRTLRKDVARALTQLNSK